MTPDPLGLALMTVTRFPEYGGTFVIAVADTGRVIALLLCSALLWMTLNVLYERGHAMDWPQWARFAGLAWVSAAIVFTEVEHFHGPVNARLPLFLVFLAHEVFGVFTIWKDRHVIPPARP